MADGKMILLACVVFAGCAAQRELPDQPAQVNLGPDGLTITAIESATVEVAPSEATTTPEDSKWQRIEEFLARQPDAGDIDPTEMLGLWDELGKFRNAYWQSLSHERRTHCVAVLALCGNEGAIRASGRLSEESLRHEGPYIANGTFGKWATSRRDSMGGFPHEEPKIYRVRISVDPALLPDWKHPSRETIDLAAAKSLPLVIYFAEEYESELDWADAELTKLSRSGAVFIKVPFTEDRERSPWAEETVVPGNRLLSDNPSREYGVPVADLSTISNKAVIVADAHGNEFFRLSRVPRSDDLKKLLDEVPVQAARTNERLQANLDRAHGHVATAERRDALKYLLKNFRTEVVGLKAQVDTIEVYNKLIDEGRTELAKLVEASDKDGLKALAREFAGTDLDKEIDEAIAKLK